MRKLNINDLNFDEFTRINSSFGGSSSNIYTDGDMVYKLYNYTTMSDIKLLKSFERRIKILSCIKDLSVVELPQDMIVEKTFLRFLLRGVSMNYLDGITLFDLYEKGREKELFEGIINASKGLEIIHERPENIVIGDTNFSNIMMLANQNGKNVIPKFIDFDSVSIGKEDFCQTLNFKLVKFFTGRDRCIFNLEINSNLDRLSYLLEFMYIVFGIDILYSLDLEEFDRLSSEIQGLKYLKPIINDLLDFNKEIPDIPYLHELFNEIDEEAFVRRYEIIY